MVKRIFFICVSVIMLVFMAGENLSNAQATGTEYVTFWSGDLRIFATKADTKVEIIDIATGNILPFSDSRVSSTNFATNPFVLTNPCDSFEGVGGLGNPNREIQVRIRATDATSGNEEKPIIVWTGSLNSNAKHPISPPSVSNAWMSYIPAIVASETFFGAELGRNFVGFTTREMYIFALKDLGNPTSITIEDLVTNTDSDSDDSRILTPASSELMFGNSEIEVYYMNDFEDDTVRIASNVDISVMVGHRSVLQSDWIVTPPSYREGDNGIELGTLFYFFANRSIAIFPTLDDTTVTITDLSDGDDSISVNLVNGDTAGDYDIYTPILDSVSAGEIKPRGSNPAVNLISNNENPIDNDILKVESDKPILVSVGPVGSDIREHADVAFSVPTGPDSRIIYCFAQNYGNSNDLQIFGFTDNTNVQITSLTTTKGFGTSTFHDFNIGPGLGGTMDSSGPWVRGTVGADVWWGAGVWAGELLRITSDKPITVIDGDYDSPHFGAFIPFVRASETYPPVADAGPDQSACTGELVHFDGTGSFDQDSVQGGGQITCHWDVDINDDSDGDGDPANDIDLTGPTPTYTYSSTGEFKVQLTFTDDDGEMDTDIIVITVEDCGVDLCPNEYRWGNPAPGYSFANWPLFESWTEVCFVNNGPGDAFNVTATITCAPVNVTVVDGVVSLGNIPAGSSAWSTGDTFTLRVDMGNPQDPDKGICWRVGYDDALGVHHVIENVAKYCGEECSSICP
jgi:hypothetical protein